MRLIDVDAVKLPKGYFENVTNVPRFYEWLDTLPTIDAEPVRYGEWIDDKSSICGDLIDRHCSLCGQLMCSVVYKKMSYCPNCGARMDGGEDAEKVD